MGPAATTLSRRAPAVALLLWAAAAGTGCTSRDDDATAPWSPEERELVLSLSPVPDPPPSPGNAVADDPRAAALGRALFFDAALSGDGTVSCATCHDPARGFGDGRPRARGAADGPRNTPSIAGAAWPPFLGWDGGKDSLWAQSLRPIEEPREMRSHRLLVARALAARHAEAYEEAFGPLPPGVADRPPQGADAVARAAADWEALAPAARRDVTRVLVNAGKALEAWQRRVTFPETRFDRYVAALRGGDASGGGHLAPAEIRGLRLFVGPARCVSCHHGPLLSDGEFHNVGLPRRDAADRGRAQGAEAVLRDEFRCGSPWSDAPACDELRFLPTGRPEQLGAFRTPSLRNVGETAPYMHDGRFETLEEVVAFYKQRPGRPALGERDPLLRQVGRGLSTADLVAFLRALDGAPRETPPGPATGTGPAGAAAAPPRPPVRAPRPARRRRGGHRAERSSCARARSRPPRTAAR